jgi:hypothetical protein
MDTNNHEEKISENSCELVVKKKLKKVIHL